MSIYTATNNNMLMILFAFQNNYGLLGLEIEITSTRNSGRYVCRAINSEGEVETTAKVDVRG